MKYITDNDVATAAQDNIPPYGALGSVVDTRTYLRWLPDKKRRETFYERNARKTNYNIGLAKDYLSEQELKKEAQLFFKRLNQLLVWGSGRVAWVGGTKATELVPESTMNCSATIIDSPSKFVVALHLLCLGCGFGFRIYPEDVAKFPEISSYPDIYFDRYNPLPKHERLENTEFEATDNTIFVLVGDSREGWCEALDILLQSVFGGFVEKITFNFDSVRPEGERINGFGGLASGHEPLLKMLAEIQRILVEETDFDEETETGRIRPINALDILCVIGDLVRSGNVRRSSEIALAHPHDKEVQNAKRGLWTDPNLSHKRYRSMSNNSISYDGIKPTLEELKELMQVIRYEGEPGFVRADLHKKRRHEAALKYRPGEDPKLYTEKAGITNPCGEINLTGGYGDLDVGSFCNLVSLPLPEFVDEKGNVDYQLLTECLQLITRFAIRQTLIEISMPEWNETQKRERLIGVDICGWWDAFDKMNISPTSEEANHLRQFCRKVVHEETDSYAAKLQIPRPLLATTGKPNGSYAQLNTIASGAHPSYAPFYIRRIRVAAIDALAKTLVKQGIPYYPEVSEWEAYVRQSLPHLIKKDEEGNEITTVWDLLDIYDDLGKPLIPQIKTLVFEFPVKTPAKRATSEISAIEQLENYKAQMLHYIDHNQSITITVGDDEWDAVAQWIYENWDHVIGVSLLPKFADDVYPLLPYQECDENEFNKRVSEFPSYPLIVDMDLLAQFEAEIESKGKDVDDVDVSSDCSTGACPVR